MFHFLLRPGEWREVTWKGIDIFENSQTARYPNVCGILGVRAPKTRRQQVHAKVQHVLVECPKVDPTARSSSTPCSCLGRRLSLLWLRRATCLRISSCPSSSWPCKHPFHNCGFPKVAAPLTTFSVVATSRLCVDGRRWSYREKLQKGTSRKECTTWKACPFLRAQQIWWLISPTWPPTPTPSTLRLERAV